MNTAIERYAHPYHRSMLHSSRAERPPRGGAGQLPALLLDLGQPPEFALYLPSRRERPFRAEASSSTGEGGLRDCPRPKCTQKRWRRSSGVLAAFPNREKEEGSDDR